MSLALCKVTSANENLFPDLLYSWREHWPGMIRLCTGMGPGIGPVSQNARERWEDLAMESGGEADGVETDLSLIMSSVFVR